MKRNVFLILGISLITLNLFAQIGVSNIAPNNTANHLINNVLVGGGVSISNIQFSGNNQQIGYFSNGVSIGMQSGIVMSSGHVMDADLGGNPASGNTPTSGVQCNNTPNTICNDLYNVANLVPMMVGQSFSVNSIHDVCVLEFDFIPQSDTIRFNYSFGSEEYLTYVNSSYNDVFGFFISGPGITGTFSSPAAFPNGSQNIATVPGTTPAMPITVSSVHPFIPATWINPSYPAVNGQYYNNGVSISYNGITDVFTAIAVVQPCETYHIRLAIADGSDDYLDSGVFLEANSFSSTTVSIDTNMVSIVSDTLFVECLDSLLTLEAGITNSNYSILWNTGDTTMSVLVGPGQYFYTATNGSCVLGSDSVTIFNQTSIQKDTIVNQITCFGLTDGTIDLTVLGGTPPYNYFWHDSVSGFNSNSEDLSNLSEGVYHCLITDSNLCPTPMISVSIVEPSSLVDSSTYTNVSCYGLNDGGIDVFVSGGISPYSVSWTSVGGYVGSGTNISNLSSDVYTATITDVNNCGPLLEFISITEPSEITLFGTSSDISCFGLNDGSIDLVTTGLDLSFSWVGPNAFSSTSEDVFSLEPGVYTVSLTDSNGCIGPSASYIINEPSDILVSYIITDVSCNGINDGSIDMTISGGVGNYTTIWNSPNGYFNISEDAFSLYSGPYNYDITDANGCMLNVNNSPLVVSQPAGIQTISVSTDETCYGDADGAIDVTINASGIFMYSWVGPNLFSSTSLDIFSLQSGTYNLTITDSNNCQTLLTESVNIGNVITLDTFITNISCYNFSDGNIVLLTPGSVNPTYNWIGPNGFTSTNSQIFNLEEGLYTVVVNDTSNCPEQLNISITEPLYLFTSAIISDESCEGYSDGVIETSVSGGTPGYTYVWSNGTNDSINSNLLNGDYILNVLDANNCIATDTFSISLYLFDTLSSVTNVSCYGGVDGSVYLDVIGGNSPFSYSWNTGDTTQNLNNIPSSVYSVNITDATDCTINRDVIITSPQQLAAVTNITSVLCYGDSTASVSLQINGGVYPYILDWGTTDTTSMQAGFHSYVITDGNNCIYTDSVEVLQNDSMQIISSVTDVQCFGDFTGEIEVQIAQGTGTPPYSYSWTGPNNFSSNSEDLLNLESGNYILTFTDINLCVQQLQLFVNQPQQVSQTTTLITSNYSGYNVRCKGESSAWVQISVSGGYTPYNFLWNNGSQTDSIYNLYAGPYSVLITDSLGCTENININLNEPSTFVSADVVSTSDFNGYNISCFSYNDGSVSVNAEYGISPYTYLWNTEEITKSISNLYSGYYEVFVYDKNMCLAIDSVTLIEPTELLFNLFYYQDTCKREVGKAEFISEGGVPNYTALWSNGSTDIVVDNLPQGNYSVEVSDANSCIKTEIFTVDNLDGPIADFEAYPYHKRFFDQQNDPFYFVDLTNCFWSSVENWTWSFGDGTYDYDSVVSHVYEENGWFTVNLQIETYANCIDTISKRVLIDEYSFYIPNSFIPSSNETKNSVFKGYGIGIKEYELKIFSRWGELIFETNNLDDFWDGTYHKNENICPQGLYTYTVFIENIYGEVFEYQGKVKLLR